MPRQNTCNPCEELVSDQDLDAAWGHAQFGDIPRRNVVAQTLLKVLGNEHSSFTPLHICSDLGLISDFRSKPRLTSKGRKYLVATFRDGTL